MPAAVNCTVHSQERKRWGTVKNLNRSGRKRKISQKLERNIMRNATTNPRTSVKDVKAHLVTMGVDVSNSTIERCLHCAGLKSCSTRKTPLLKKYHLFSLTRKTLRRRTNFGTRFCGRMRPKLNFMGTMTSRLYGGKRARPTTQRTQSLRSSMAGETSCYRAAFRPVVLENLFESVE